MKKININKVILISLPTEGQSGDYYSPEYAVDDFAVYPPLGLLYVGTSIEEHYNTELLDPVAKKLNIDDTVSFLKEKKPTVLGISCQSYRIYPCAEIIKRIKLELPELIVFVGGPHTTAYPYETFNLPGVDYVVVGDGDFSVKMLLDALTNGDEDELSKVPGLIYDSNGKIKCNEQSNEKDLDKIPFPNRDLLDYRDYYTAADGASEVITMISSRGCPFKCVYCDVLEKKFRFRSPKNVVDEMEIIANKYKDPVIHIFDDTFNLSRRRVINICNEIIERGVKIKWTTRARVHPFDEEMAYLMAKSGLKRAHFGVESGSEKSLKMIKKGINIKQITDAFNICKKYKIESLAYFIIGFDWETEKEIQETVNFTRKINPDFVMAFMLHPLAKTTVYQEIIDKGIYSGDLWQEQAKNPVPEFRLPPHRSAKIRKYLRRKVDEIYIGFYLKPSFIISQLADKKSRKQGGLKISELLFKVKLSFLMIKSWCKNYIIEITDKDKLDWSDSPSD